MASSPIHVDLFGDAPSRSGARESELYGRADIPSSDWTIYGTKSSVACSEQSERRAYLLAGRGATIVASIAHSAELPEAGDWHRA